MMMMNGVNKWQDSKFFFLRNSGWSWQRNVHDLVGSVTKEKRLYFSLIALPHQQILKSHTIEEKIWGREAVKNKKTLKNIWASMNNTNDVRSVSTNISFASSTYDICSCYIYPFSKDIFKLCTLVIYLIPYALLHKVYLGMVKFLPILCF